MKFMLTLVTSAALAITSSLSPNIYYQATQKDQTALLSNNIITQTKVKTPLVNAPSLVTISGDTATISETYNNVPVTYVNLPKTVCNNSKIKELVFPSRLSLILSEDYIEMENSMVQYFNSITPNCPNLSKVTVSSNNTNFKSIDGVLYSKDGTILYYCPPAKTGDLVIPEGVTTIDLFAFQNCSKLTSISIPSTTKDIYRAAFGGNSSLKTIKVADSNPYLKAVSNVLFSADGETLYAYPSGKSNEEYIIPDGVITILEGAFMGNSYLTKINAPTSLQQVGTEAFENCRAITSIKFTSKLLDIYAGAFLDCKNITDITLPYGTRIICEKAFEGCNNLLKIKFPSSIIRIPDDLGTVKNRTIFYYSPFYTGDLGDKSKLAKGLITYAYKGSIAEARLKSEGITVRNYSKPYAIVSKPGKAPSKAITGTGKPNTSWYNKNNTTYTISNPDQLAGLAILVNKGIEFKGKTIQLTKDLNLVHYSNWTAIGKDPMKDGEPIYTFRGTFDGKGHSIYNLRINAIKKGNVGLFGILNGTVKNLNIEDADVLGCSEVGILAGSSSGTINKCHVCGNIRGSAEIGGLVGTASGIISACNSTATIHGIEKTGVLVGVFAGKGLEGRELKDSSSKGYVSGLYMVGGIVGELRSGIITNCENSSTVKGRLYVGGIIGILGNGDSVNNCTNHTPVVGSTDVGGIVGKLGGDKTINQCTNLASITGENNIGGIVGETVIGKLTNSKNEGEITGNSCVGGILGKLGSHYPSNYENILNCENTGNVNATRYNGNLIGKEGK